MFTANKCPFYFDKNWTNKIKIKGFGCVDNVSYLCIKFNFMVANKIRILVLLEQCRGCFSMRFGDQNFHPLTAFLIIYQRVTSLTGGNHFPKKGNHFPKSGNHFPVLPPIILNYNG